MNQFLMYLITDRMFLANDTVNCISNTKKQNKIVLLIQNLSTCKSGLLVFLKICLMYINGLLIKNRHISFNTSNRSFFSTRTYQPTIVMETRKLMWYRNLHFNAVSNYHRKKLQKCL